MTRLVTLDRQPYRATLALMRELHGAVARGETCDTWLVVEHDPVITLGRNAKRENVLASAEALATRGIDIVAVERGGDATYHGPGQLVVYPVVRLERFREIVPLVSALERSAIAALATFGVDARRREEHRGVYVGANAICAVGLAVKQMTSLHGLALNVSTDLDYDRIITPCGTPQFGITSLARELGRAVSMDAAREALVASLEREFATSFVADTASRAVA
ncbi:MAG: lipoyl(octanoyl) transferase LipB [Vulcanimicrobiaceae bacterium]